jgi:hypothetical protein
MLVDPELAERARKLLREPCETDGKGWHMSALGTHEITAGIGLGLEPPLSPPVVRGPSASMAMPANDGLSGLPTPPPAIRPPESAIAVPAAAPAPQAEVPQPAPQTEQAPAAPAQPEPVEQVAAPEPVQLQPEPPAVASEPELPAMAPAEEPVLDYFAQPQPAAETLPEVAPAEESQAETVQLPEIQPIPLAEPIAAVEEPVEELPTMAPPEAAAEAAPVAFLAPQPVEVAPEPVAQVEIEIEVEAEPVAELTPEAELELISETVEAHMPALEPLAIPEPVATTELEELFAPKRSGQFCVVVRLKEGDGVEVGSFRDFGTAMEGAQEVIEQFSTATDGQWPFYAGRFIRPDLIVSVDVLDGDQA